MKHSISIFFLILGLLVYGIGVYYHEVVHQVIFTDYGGESKIGFSFKELAAQTTLINGSCTGRCSEMQNMNEMISYNLEPIFIILWLGISLILFQQENKT